MIISEEFNPVTNKIGTRVLITESTTKSDIESTYPLLQVKEDELGQYIRTKHCRFVPGTYFFLSISGIPTYYFSNSKHDN
jgi:hypothetical protein